MSGVTCRVLDNPSPDDTTSREMLAMLQSSMFGVSVVTCRVLVHP